MQPAESSDISGPYPRRAHKKSRRGCRNCKARKVKCDEQRPLCGPCAKHYSNIERCDYESLPDTRPVRRTRTSGLAENPTSLQSDIPVTVGAEMIDPFRMHPRTPINNPSILLWHYLTNVVNRSFPFFNTKSIIDLWWPFLREDELLFNVVLYLSAVSLNALGHGKGEAYSARLMVECIGLLRARVAQSLYGVSDGTVIAVANLLAIEHSRGDIKSAKMHLDGLKHIVAARGGLDSLRDSSPMAANIAFWISMIVSNQSDSLPIVFDPNNSLHRFPRDLALNNIGAEFYSDEEARELVLQEANHMSQMFTTTILSPSTEEGLFVLDHLSSLMQALFQLAPKSDTEVGIGRLLRSCRYAAALHVFYPLCGYYPDPTYMVNSMVLNLKASLNIYETFLALHPALVLWMFFVGGVSACNLPERNWFIDHLVMMTEDLEIHTWHQMSSHLTSVVWYAVFCESSFQTLWAEIEAKSKELDVSKQELPKW